MVSEMHRRFESAYRFSRVRSSCSCESVIFSVVFFFHAEDGIRDLVRFLGFAERYIRQVCVCVCACVCVCVCVFVCVCVCVCVWCLLYTSGAGDYPLCIDLCGRCHYK